MAMPPAEQTPAPIRHRPVMLAQVIEALKPHDGGIYVDGTFGAGGYSGALLEAADTRVIGIDRDPQAIAEGQALKAKSPDRLALVLGRFGDMDRLVPPCLRAWQASAVDGVTLDLGVSSMQLDQPMRGFSFLRDGPLDMRMGGGERSAADLVNTLPEAQLQRIIAVLGEERRARAIARAIAKRRIEAPFARTGELAALIERVSGKPAAAQRIHPATRTFQALRIAVNHELDELVDGLEAAEHLLKPGGRLAVVSFHSLEDRIVKRFIARRSGAQPRGSRHLPDRRDTPVPPSFADIARGGIAPEESETAGNPRARSARLRIAERTHAPVHARPDGELRRLLPDAEAPSC